MRIEDIEKAYGLKVKAERLRGMAMELADALAKGYSHGKVAELLEGDMKWMLNTNKPKTLDGDDVGQLAAIVAGWMKAHSDGLMDSLNGILMQTETPSALGLLRSTGREVTLPADLPACGLRPFDRVLVRDDDGEEWRIEFFDSYHEEEKFPYMCLTARYAQCVPYNDDTAHLLGASKPAPSAEDHPQPHVGTETMEIVKENK